MKSLARMLMIVLALWMAASLGQTAARQALLLEVDGTIGPAVSDFVIRGIEKGEQMGVELVILRMDTPGGLDSAMRDIIRKIVASTVPVVTYVAPSGARAASAGTYILYASHIAAMAPATNLGAATPVQIGPGELPGSEDWQPDKETDEEDGEPAKTKGAMERKIVNDAVAYIRGLALMRGRNADWAEKAVRQAASLTAQEALGEGVIDVVAADVSALLEQLNGRQVRVMDELRTLDTEDLTVVAVEPDWRNRLLAIITDPNVAYVLMLLGIYGLFFELSNPGSIFPGVVGAICLLLALYAFQVLPVNYAGLALLILGIAFMVGEVFMPSFGALGIGGVIAFITGSLILMETDLEGYTLSIPLVIVFTAVSAGFFIMVVGMAVRQRRQPVVTGQEGIVGSAAEVLEGFEVRGRVRAQGELWEARTSRPVKGGQRVRVRAMDGLTLIIEPLEQED